LIVPKSKTETNSRTPTPLNETGIADMISITGINESKLIKDIDRSSDLAKKKKVEIISKCEKIDRKDIIMRIFLHSL